MTELEQDAAITAITSTLASLSDTISLLSTQYVSKLQWKQLDTVRLGEIQVLTDKVTDLESRVTILENNL